MTVYISNREVEEIAEGLVNVLYGATLPNRIDIDGIARYLGLNVIYEAIAETDIDKIGFLSDGKTPLTIRRNGECRKQVYPKNTIVLDGFLLRKEEEGRRRFTLAHEIGHVLLNRADPLHAAACYNRVCDLERMYSIREFQERLSLGETQANAMAAELLMPRKLLESSVRRYFKRKFISVYGNCVFLPEDKLPMQKMADEIGVSYTAMLIQLRKYGLLIRRDMSEYFKKTGGSNG